MKTKIFIFSSLLCLCGAISGHCSDCTGADCELSQIVYDGFETYENFETPSGESRIHIVAKPTPPVVETGWLDNEPEFEYIPTTQIPMRTVSAKMLSIKPVPEDTRPALWDGVHGEYSGPTADKTVDWRDGVPIWDDSIASYKYKDFSDWFLADTLEIYLRDAGEPDPMQLYQQNMADAAATRARVEELLAPQKPADNLWFESAPRKEYVAQDMTVIVQETFGNDDGCPFESETECEIWRRKPIVRETVSPRSPKLRDTKISDFVAAANCNKHITANEEVSAPLLDRYKMLMRSAQACCTDGMAHALKQAGASDGLVYKFLSDDANFYGFGSRCLMMTDYDLDSQYPNTATSVVAADVRNGCLCRGRQWFTAMLAPFQQVYNALPEFKDTQFNYTYKDGLQREITVSINNDVQNVLRQLAQCP